MLRRNTVPSSRSGTARALAALVCALAVFAVHAAERVALLIGNNQYPTAPLRNAVNDARDLAATLRDLGFQVILRENASRKDMIEGIRDFGQALEGAQTALFFYAGHAMQFKDRNYLIPIDAAMGSEEDITFFSVEISQVFDRMDRARTRFNFILLDACRDNPFASSFKVTNSGLAQMSAPSGTLIAYATAPGSVAADGGGRNGIYTKHILQNIKAPDLPAEIMFKRVREGVERETRRLQTPWDSSSLKGDFSFNPTGHVAASASGASPSADATLQIEREFWISVRDSNRPEDIQAYLDKYPNGNFTALAKNRLEALIRPTRVAASAPPATQAAAPPPPVQATRTTTPVQSETQPAAASAARDPAPERTAKPETVATAEAASAEKKAATPEASKKTGAAEAEKPVVVAAAAPSSPKAPDMLPGKEIAPGVRELTFPDGAIYRGGVHGTKLHGKGEYISKNFKYEGDWSEGLKQGHGVYVWDNGDRYEGTFAGDRPDGKGAYKFANGDAYEGEVKQGVISGRGIYVARNGDTFEGPFSNGKLDGVGVYKFASGDRYEGDMKDGVIQGAGHYYARNGDRIEGSFVDGKPQGIGKYYFANGDRYEGEIIHGALTGQGTYYYASGLKYQGEVRDGRPQGKGVFWFQDGSRFDGTFEDGLTKAKGDLVKADGTRAPAEMVDGIVRLLNN